MTALLDEASFRHFDALRQQYFPPALNRVPAHLTLFHNLPGDELPAMAATAGAVCRRYEPQELAITGLKFMGKGVAYAIECPALARLHSELANEWDRWLIPQDRQPFRPHIVIQNKAQPEAARTLHQILSAEFVPFDATIEGLQLWHYRQGPWEPAETIRFKLDDPLVLSFSAKAEDPSQTI